MSHSNLLLCAAVMLAGCSSAQPPPEKATASVNLGTRYAREFRLQDGTLCVAIMDTGITCNWNNTTQVEK